jgi:hypothetical protein
MTRVGPQRRRKKKYGNNGIVQNFVKSKMYNNASNINQE